MAFSFSCSWNARFLFYSSSLCLCILEQFPWWLCYLSMERWNWPRQSSAARTASIFDNRFGGPDATRSQHSLGLQWRDNGRKMPRPLDDDSRHYAKAREYPHTLIDHSRNRVRERYQSISENEWQTNNWKRWLLGFLIESSFIETSR